MKNVQIISEMRVKKLSSPDTSSWKSAKYKFRSADHKKRQLQILWKEFEWQRKQRPFSSAWELYGWVHVFLNQVNSSTSVIGDDSVQFEDEFMYFSIKVAACTSAILGDSNVLLLAEKCWRYDDDWFQVISSVGSGGNAISQKSSWTWGLGIFQN